MDFLAQSAPIGNASPIIWAFVLIGIALVLFCVEIFVPSGGLIALLGALAVIASLIAFFIHDVNTGLIATGIYILFGPVLAWIAFRIWAASPLAKRMILGGIVEEDADEARQRSIARQQEQQSHLQSYIGKQGTAVTILRPVGVVRISIEAESTIEVVAVYDNQVKVRVVSPQE